MAQRLKSYDSQLAQYDREMQARLDRRSHRHLDHRPGHRAAQPKDLRGLGTRGPGARTTCSTSATSCSTNLSEHVEVTAIKQGDGRINVFIGSGQPLVVGDKASRVVAIPDPYDVSRSGIGLKVSSGPTVDITQQSHRRHARRADRLPHEHARSHAQRAGAYQRRPDRCHQRAASRGHRSERRISAATSLPSAARKACGTRTIPAPRRSASLARTSAPFPKRITRCSWSAARGR